MGGQHGPTRPPRMYTWAEARRIFALELQEMADRWSTSGSPPDSCGCTWAPVDVLRHVAHYIEFGEEPKSVSGQRSQSGGE